jgi:hypothetical protein
MTTQTVKIPDSKKSDFNSFIKQIGGEIITDKKTPDVIAKEEDEDDEVTHGVFFGENINRVIKTFKKS